MSLLNTSMVNSIKMDLPHSVFSPSQSSWVYDSDEQFADRLKNKFRSDLGVEFHEWACTQIQLGQKWSNARDIMKSVKTMIFDKYKYRDRANKLNMSYKGLMLLRAIQYIDPVVYDTLKLYITDAVKYDMEPEVELSYSNDFTGTADCLKFTGNTLLIHDLKTGTTPAHFDQLLLYSIYYCTQNHINPDTIDIVLRIYQGGTVEEGVPTHDDIFVVKESLAAKSKIIEQFKGGRL